MFEDVVDDDYDSFTHHIVWFNNEHHLASEMHTAHLNKYTIPHLRWIESAEDHLLARHREFITKATKADLDPKRLTHVNIFLVKNGVCCKCTQSHIVF